jgi:hypothetical protein
MKTRAKLTRGERQYGDHAQRAHAQGLSLARYCRENGLNVQSLYNDKHRLRRKGALSEATGSKSSERKDFIAVRVAHVTPSAAEGTVCRLRAANGWVLECAHWPSATWIVECLGGGAHASA